MVHISKVCADYALHYTALYELLTHPWQNRYTMSKDPREYRQKQPVSRQQVSIALPNIYGHTATASEGMKGMSEI